MARRRHVKGGSDEKTARGARAGGGTPIHRGGSDGLPWWVPVVLVVAIVVAIIVGVNEFREGEEDGGESVGPTVNVVNITFDATLEPERLFILEGGGGNLTLTLNNTGNVPAAYDIRVEHSEGITVDAPLKTSLGPNRTLSMAIPVESTESSGDHNVTVRISLNLTRTWNSSWNDTANGTVNWTVNVPMRTVGLNARVWVSRYGLRLDALDAYRSASPGQNVTFVLELANTGTLDERVEVVVADFVVKGNRSAWTEPDLEVNGSFVLFTNDVTHFRVNLSVPETSDPFSDIARVLVEVRSLSARDAGVPLTVETWLQLNVTKVGIMAEPDAYDKDVLPGEWVNFTVTVLNVGETPLKVKYNIDLIPQTWGRDLETPPENGWEVRPGTPIRFRIGLHPHPDLQDTHLTLEVRVYDVDGEVVEDSFRITAHVVGPDHVLFSTGSVIYIDLERIHRAEILRNTTGWVRHPVWIQNVVGVTYTVHLQLVVPSGWTGLIDLDIVDLHPDEVVNLTMRLTLPVWTPPGDYPITVRSDVEGTLQSLDFTARVPSYLNGTYGFVDEVPELVLPRPEPNSTSNGSFAIIIENTGNDEAVFEIEIVNYDNVGHLPNWTVNLSSGATHHSNKLAVTVPRNGSVVVLLNVLVSEGYDPDSIAPDISIHVMREPPWAMPPFMVDVHVQ
ncbi:MAG TPA: hypothetical protein EYP43_04290 [Thermoplasmata archaeon]|nr:hypothetical protein [Thermoplasmata archaeon]